MLGPKQMTDDALIEAYDQIDAKAGAEYTDIQNAIVAEIERRNIKI